MFECVAGIQHNFLLTAWHNPQRVNINHNVTNQFIRNVLGYQTGLLYTKLLASNKQLHLNLSHQGNATLIQKRSNAGFGTLVMGMGFSFGK